MITAIITALTGNYFAVLTEKRIKTLECIVLMIKNIKAQISYTRIPLTDIIENLVSVEEYKSLKFLNMIRNDISKGKTFSKSWKKAVKAFVGINGFKNEDAALLISFGETLGGTDINSQIENCETYINLLSLKLEQLKKNSKSKEKIYNSMGILAAALIVILFI